MGLLPGSKAGYVHSATARAQVSERSTVFVDERGLICFQKSFSIDILEDKLSKYALFYSDILLELEKKFKMAFSIRTKNSVKF